MLDEKMLDDHYQLHNNNKNETKQNVIKLCIWC